MGDRLFFDSMKFSMKTIVGLGGVLPVDDEGHVIAEDEFNIHSHCRLNIDSPKDGKVMRKFKSGNKGQPKYDIVTKTVSINAQQFLAEMVKEDLGIERMPQVVWRYGSNALSPQLISMLEMRGLELKAYRLRFYKLIDRLILDEVMKLCDQYRAKFGIFIHPSKVKVYLKSAEIVNDEVGRPEDNLMDSEEFRRRFDEVVHDEETCYFDEDNRKTTIAKPEKPGVILAHGSRRPKMIFGHLKNRTKFKAYDKVVDKAGVLTRLESKSGDLALDQILGGTGSRQIRFFPQADEKKVKPSQLLKKVRKPHLARVTRIFAYRSLEKLPKHRRQLERAIAQHCGRFAREIFDYYVKYRVIHTGRKSVLSQGAQRSISECAAKNVLFAKKERGEYGLDRRWFKRWKAAQYFAGRESRGSASSMVH